MVRFFKRQLQSVKRGKDSVTRVTVIRTKAGFISSITAEGHSGYAKSGEDIVCASVSSLMQALWIGLDEILEVEDLRTERDEEIPRIGLAWDPDIPGTQIVAGTIARALEAMGESYPDYVDYREITEK